MIDNATALAGVTLWEKIKKHSLNLAKILRDIRSEYSRTVQHKHIRIELHSPGEVWIQANPIISEVFKNYLSNAIKFSPPGSKIILEVQENGTVIRACVRDFGKTIPARYREYVFQRRTRLDMKKAGRGLGLAIVKRIAEAHGTRVWVEPNKPKRNRFCLELSQTA